MASASIRPERGLRTDSIVPFTTACTSEYSNERSVPSIVQSISVRFLQ